MPCGSNSPMHHTTTERPSKTRRRACNPLPHGQSTARSKALGAHGRNTGIAVSKRLFQPSATFDEIRADIPEPCERAGKSQQLFIVSPF